jgi:hypothetical protein
MIVFRKGAKMQRKAPTHQQELTLRLCALAAKTSYSSYSKVP